MPVSILNSVLPWVALVHAAPFILFWILSRIFPIFPPEERRISLDR